MKQLFETIRSLCNDILSKMGMLIFDCKLANTYSSSIIHVPHSSILHPAKLVASFVARSRHPRRVLFKHLA